MTSESRAPAVCARAGITHRQLDFWTHRGYVHADIDAPGSGTRRHWSDQEVEIASMMQRLIEAGLIVEVAAGIARCIIGCGSTKFDLAAEISLEVAYSQRHDT